jgi:hypothetical protein
MQFAWFNEKVDIEENSLFISNLLKEKSNMTSHLSNRFQLTRRSAHGSQQKKSIDYYPANMGTSGNSRVG